MKRRSSVRRVALAGVLGAAASITTILGTTTPAGAANFTVNSTSFLADAVPGDGLCATSLGSCTLRAAIEEANALPGTDAITVPAGNYTFDSVLTISSTMTIVGDGIYTTLFDGGDGSSVLRVEAGAGSTVASIRHVSIQNGRTTQTGGTTAGLSVAEGATMYLTDARVRNNASSVFGGGIQNWGTLTLRRVSVTGNTLPTSSGGGLTSQGGGIFNAGDMTIAQSFIGDNTANRGAGISNTNEDTSLEITNSTITENTAMGAGGGIRNVAGAQVSLNASTITRNTANAGNDGSHPRVGGGIYNGDTSAVSMANSILADNSDGRSQFSEDFSPDCWSAEPSMFQSERYNIVGVLQPTCIFEDSVFGNGAFIESGTPATPLDAGLSFSTTGTPPTYWLQPTSIAVDGSDAAMGSGFFDCPSSDQRGHRRSNDGDLDGDLDCDIGAYELRPNLPPGLQTCAGTYTATVVIPWGDLPTPGNDVIVGSPGNDIISGLGGDDVICGHGGDDVISGGFGNDIIDGGDGADIIHGSAGNDYIYGGLGNDVLYGDANDDVLEGAEGSDELRGGSGVDYLRGGPGYDTMFGDLGNDWIVSGSEPDSLDGGIGHDILLGDGGDDNVVGGSGNDYLRGGTGEGVLIGGDGDDYLEWIGGGLGTLNGGPGNDTLLGGSGDDSLLGGSGSDYLAGNGGTDSFDGGDDRDTLDGGPEGETMSGGDGDDLIYGRGGNDVLRGQGGSDYLDGGAGTDTCDGGAGIDFAEPSCESAPAVP